ncbi:unnamed protein product, partial [Closterium sp. NIES-54]
MVGATGSSFAITSASIAAFAAFPFQLANASLTVIVEISYHRSGSACISGSSSGNV